MVAEHSVDTAHERVVPVTLEKVSPQLIRTFTQVNAVLLSQHTQVLRTCLFQVAVSRQRLVYDLHPERFEQVLQVSDGRDVEVGRPECVTVIFLSLTCTPAHSQIIRHKVTMR